VSGDEPTGSVQVLRKVALILERLAEEGELGAGRLAELVGEPRSTVHRLLTSLQSLDMVEPGSRRGTYRLGLKLLRLGSAVVSRFDERQAALPVMERVHEQTGETVFLCIRRGHDAVCIERIDGRWVQSMALRLGGALPLHVGAAPRVLLAAEPREFWEEYAAAAGGLEAFTEATPASRGRLFAELELVRDTGVSVSDEDVVVGMAAIGAPIRDYRGRVCAALSMSGPKPAILEARQGESVALITSAAAEISRALGWSGEPAPARTATG
jgi:DNA-binding IclR family transcriptional regulator